MYLKLHLLSLLTLLLLGEDNIRPVICGSVSGAKFTSEHLPISQTPLDFDDRDFKSEQQRNKYVDYIDTEEGSYKSLLFRQGEKKTCTAETVYTIISASDLKLPNNLENANCIFAAGLAPTQVPLGPMYGNVLSVGNTQLFNGVLNSIWWGKIISPFYCAGSPIRTEFIGWNNFVSQLEVPFIASIGPINIPLVAGEYNDGKDVFIIDYTRDFSTICSSKELEAFQLVEKKFNDTVESERSLIPSTNIFPVNTIYDVARFVGRQQDGGAIYLGKAYIKGIDGLSRDVISFSIVNYDPDVLVHFAPGDSLPPLENDFEYSTGIF